MSAYCVPFARQELLHHMLRTGGCAVCELVDGQRRIQASFNVELTDNLALVKVALGDQTGELSLRRASQGNHVRLRNFLEEIANGHLETAKGPRPAEAQDTPQVLSSQDESLLRHISRQIGTRMLDCGAVVSVHPATDEPMQLHALVSCRGKTELLTAPTSGELYVSMAVLIERQLAA